MTVIKMRRDTAAGWTASNPILAEGEIGFEKDTNKFKFGDGATVWSTLKYFLSETAIPSVSAFESLFAVSSALGNNSTDATAGIQSQLDAANTVGKGHVFVPPGVYLISATLFIGSNTWLELAPGATIKRNASIDNMIRNRQDGVAGGYTAATDILVTGGTWDANGAGFAANTCALAFGHASRVEVRDTTIKNVYGWHHLEFNAVQHGKAKNVKFLDAILQTGRGMLQFDLMKSVGEWPWTGPFDNTPCDDIEVSGCTFRNGFRAIESHTSTTGFRHTNIRITNNHFLTFSTEAVRMQDWQDVVISNNTFNDCWKCVYGTATQICLNLNISNNIMDNVKPADTLARAIDLDGVAAVSRFLRNIVVKGNTISNVGRYGFGTAFLQNLICAENEVTGCVLTGIWIYQCTKINVTGNQSYGNNASANTAHSDLLIGVTGSGTNTQDVIVKDNNVGTMQTQSADRVIIAHNIIAGAYTEAGTPTNVQRASNFINGVWVP